MDMVCEIVRPACGVPGIFTMGLYDTRHLLDVAQLIKMTRIETMPPEIPKKTTFPNQNQASTPRFTNRPYCRPTPVAWASATSPQIVDYVLLLKTH